MGKMRSFLLILLLTILLVHSTPVEAVDFEETKNAQGEVVFRVLDENRVMIPNRHREKKPSLKLSLHGTTVESIEMKNGSSSSWSMVLGDKTSVDVSIREHGNGTSEYSFLWHGGGPKGKREICFHYESNHAFWYNGYQSKNASWPMNTETVIPKQQFNYLFNYSRFNGNLYSDQEAILILEQLFFTSDGFAIVLDHHSPLFIQRTPNKDDPLLCFSVDNHIPFMTSNLDPAYLDIKFVIFASNNARKVTDFVVHQSGLIPAPKVIPDTKMFENPTWLLWEMNNLSGKENVLSLANDIIKNGFSSKSKIIFTGWDSSDTDNLLNLTKYPEESLISQLHKQGFEVGFELTQLNAIEHELTKQYLIKSTRYIDFSISEACKYFISKLSSLKFEKQIDSYLFNADNIISDYEFKDTFVQKYPSLLTTKFLETANQVGNTIISEYAFKTQHLPVWVRLANDYYGSFDKTLRELIPNALSVSIAGYSFIVPYTVGGFQYDHKPSEELFIRMMQAVTFMPAISIGKKPWEYSAKAVEITRKCLQLHSDHVPLMLELAHKRITDGSPIVQPLWYVAPDDPKTYPIGDQYMLGDNILVAPVVTEGQHERKVYFPTGTWIDQHGKSFQGPNEFTIAAPIEELPYFKRKL